MFERTVVEALDRECKPLSSGSPYVFFLAGAVLGGCGVYVLLRPPTFSDGGEEDVVKDEQ